MKRTIIVLALLALASLFSACGSTAGNTGVAATSAPTVQPTPTFTSSPQPKTADQILQFLKTQKLPIGASIVYTVDNDVNHLLGRPGQYTGKANFIDTRLTTTDTGVAISVSDGGSTETFDNMTDANARFAYIQQISKSSPLFAEYEYQGGLAVLRISSTLTPTQAQAYSNAFKKALG